MTYDAIGRRLGISKQRVEQIEKRTIIKLRKLINERLMTRQMRDVDRSAALDAETQARLDAEYDEARKEHEAFDRAYPQAKSHPTISQQ